MDVSENESNSFLCELRPIFTCRTWIYIPLVLMSWSSIKFNFDYYTLWFPVYIKLKTADKIIAAVICLIKIIRLV